MIVVRDFSDFAKRFIPAVKPPVITITTTKEETDTSIVYSVVALAGNLDTPVAAYVYRVGAVSKNATVEEISEMEKKTEETAKKLRGDIEAAVSMAIEGWSAYKPLIVFGDYR